MEESELEISSSINQPKTTPRIISSQSNTVDILRKILLITVVLLVLIGLSVYIMLRLFTHDSQKISSTQDELSMSSPPNNIENNNWTAVVSDIYKFSFNVPPEWKGNYYENQAKFAYLNETPHFSLENSQIEKWNLLSAESRIKYKKTNINGIEAYKGSTPTIDGEIIIIYLKKGNLVLNILYSLNGPSDNDKIYERVVSSLKFHADDAFYDNFRIKKLSEITPRKEVHEYIFEPQSGKWNKM